MTRFAFLNSSHSEEDSMQTRIRSVMRATIALTIVAAAMAATAVSPAQGAPRTMPMKAGQVGQAPADDSLRARFRLLSRQTSNNCALQPAGVMQMAPSARLQGSCCAPMDYAEYVKQIHGLGAYTSVPEIPRDPYNVQVGLAQKLFGYDRQLTLDAAQQAVYKQAMKLSDEGGPCCCRCWRYAAFRGQAKELIERRRYTAKQIAEVWDLEDGCGGNDKSGGMMGNG
jgi:hypothetical protein